MNKFSVTLKALRRGGACVDGYNKLVRSLQGRPFSDSDSQRDSYIRYKHDAPILLTDIVDSNGFEDALWALRCVGNADKDARLFAVWCARQVEHLMKDPRSKEALDVAERYAYGKATDSDLAVAWDAAWDAARDAARDAVQASAGDAVLDAARDAARAAAWATERDAFEDAAWGAARDAVWAAAEGVAEGTAWNAAKGVAVWNAARAAAVAAQCDTFVKMCNNEASWHI